MALSTFTRRHVVDMLPEYLTKRVASYQPKREALLRELGVSSETLMALNVGLFFADGDRVRRERYAWRSPYGIKPPAALAAWTQAVAAGLAEETADGWKVSARGLEMARTARRRLRDHLRSLPLPADAVRGAADALTPVADRIPADSEHAALPRRDPPSAEELRADIIRLTRAVEELWYFRDECHIGAWRDAGYDGPAFDVLSVVWGGRSDQSFTKLAGATTVDTLAEAMKARQDRADVERNVDALVRRGDLEREDGTVRLTAAGRKAREAIEDETDRRFFAIWHLEDAASARLAEDLREVIDALARPS